MKWDVITHRYVFKANVYENDKLRDLSLLGSTEYGSLCGPVEPHEAPRPV